MRVLCVEDEAKFLQQLTLRADELLPQVDVGVRVHIHWSGLLATALVAQMAKAVEDIADLARALLNLASKEECTDCYVLCRAGGRRMRHGANSTQPGSHAAASWGGAGLRLRRWVSRAARQPEIQEAGG
eukprot:scaffold123169_cov35-Tisochrysis_lutea.AAC.2